jgi:hypothetical protein
MRGKDQKLVMSCLVLSCYKCSGSVRVTTVKRTLQIHRAFGLHILNTSLPSVFGKHRGGLVCEEHPKTSASICSSCRAPFGACCKVLFCVATTVRRSGH